MEFKKRQVAKHQACSSCFKTGHKSAACEYRKECIFPSCKEFHHPNMHTQQEFKDLRNSNNGDKSSRTNHSRANQSINKDWLNEEASEEASEEEISNNQTETNDLYSNLSTLDLNPKSSKIVCMNQNDSKSVSNSSNLNNLQNCSNEIKKCSINEHGKCSIKNAALPKPLKTQKY